MKMQVGIFRSWRWRGSRRFASNRKGTVTVFVAVFVPVIFGLAALAVDGGAWYMQRRTQQDAADMAALAGAVQIGVEVQQNILNSNGTPVQPVSSTTSSTGVGGGSCTNATDIFGVHDSALYLASLDGYTNNQGGNCVTVNWPPTSGTYVNNDAAVEVIVQKPAPALFTLVDSAFAGFRHQSIDTRAVAIYSIFRTNVCVLSLDSMLAIQGSSSIEAPDCTFASNSQAGGSNSGNNVNQQASFYVNGSTCSNNGANNQPCVTPTRDIGNIVAIGNCTNCSTASKSVAQHLNPGTYATKDPFMNTIGQLGTLFEGATNLASGHGNKVTKTAPSAAGEYYGLDLSSDTTMAPGLYVIGAGGLTISGNANVTCVGCTFIVTNGGMVSINSGSTTDLEAPSASTTWVGDLKSASTNSSFFSNFPQLVSYATNANEATLASYMDGMLIYSDVSTQNPSQIINGTAGSTLYGALYFPNAPLTLTGNAQVNGSPSSSCLMAVAYSVTFGGNNNTALAYSGCSNLGLPAVNVPEVRIAE